VLPGYVRATGFSAIVAGLVIGSQYLALLSRPMAGRMSDTLGTKRAIVYGLSGIVLSGLLTLISTLLQDFPVPSLLILIVGRLLLGVAQGLIGVGTISWCMGQVGVEHTARSIGWNGIASYGAIAIGAPLGVVMVADYGFTSLGIALSVLAAAALVLINKPSVPVVRGERLPLGGIRAHRTVWGQPESGVDRLRHADHLHHPLLPQPWLERRGVLPDGIRRVLHPVAAAVHFGDQPFGGFNSAIACMSIETLGLVLLWLAPSTAFALIGAGLAGFGLSLVYPALGVEAIKQVPSSSRGSGLGLMRCSSIWHWRLPGR
jgi:MFS family permease